MSTVPPSYLKERLEKQVDWHSKKSALNKKRFYAAEVIALIAGALIPIINVVELSTAWQRAGSAGLASAIVISTGLSKLFKFRDNWLNYRGLAEELHREKEFYLNRIGDYAADDETVRQQSLVQRTETILSTTTKQYILTNITAGGEKTEGAGKS